MCVCRKFKHCPGCNRVVSCADVELSQAGQKACTDVTGCKTVAQAAWLEMDGGYSCLDPTCSFSQGYRVMILAQIQAKHDQFGPNAQFWEINRPYYRAVPDQTAPGQANIVDGPVVAGPPHHEGFRGDYDPSALVGPSSVGPPQPARFPVPDENGDADGHHEVVDDDFASGVFGGGQPPQQQVEGPGVAAGVAPGVIPGVIPGIIPGIGPGVGPGAGPGVVPGVGPGVGPGVAHGPAPRAGPLAGRSARSRRASGMGMPRSAKWAQDDLDRLYWGRTQVPPVSHAELCRLMDHRHTIAASQSRWVQLKRERNLQ